MMNNTNTNPSQSTNINVPINPLPGQNIDQLAQGNLFLISNGFNDPYRNFKALQKFGGDQQLAFNHLVNKASTKHNRCERILSDVNSSQSDPNYRHCLKKAFHHHQKHAQYLHNLGYPNNQNQGLVDGRLSPLQQDLCQFNRFNVPFQLPGAGRPMMNQGQQQPLSQGVGNSVPQFIPGVNCQEQFNHHRHHDFHNPHRHHHHHHHHYYPRDQQQFDERMRLNRIQGQQQYNSNVNNVVPNIQLNQA